MSLFSLCTLSNYKGPSLKWKNLNTLKHYKHFYYAINDTAKRAVEINSVIPKEKPMVVDVTDHQPATPLTSES